jgi:hypothetical protein
VSLLSLVVLGCNGPEGKPLVIGPQPKAVVVGSKEHDFGYLERGRSGEHDFIIRNEGDAPLELILGPTSCQCTIGELENGTLKPGEETTIKLTWEAKSDDRYFRQTAQVLTNDSETGSIELIVHGKVVELVSATPNTITLNNVTAGGGQDAVFVIHSPEFERFEITGHEFRKPELAEFFELETEPATREQLEEHEGAKSGYTGRIKLLPGLPLGQFSQTIFIKTDAPGTSPIGVTVQGNVAGDLSVIGGGYLSEFGVLPIGQVFQTDGAVRTLQMLVGGEHQDIEIQNIENSHPEQVQVDVGKSRNLGNKTSFPITITIPIGAPPVSCLGPQAGGYAEILIRTTHPVTPTVRILVKFSVVAL